MSSGRNMVTVYFVAIGGLLLAGLVLFAPWPFWGTLVAGAALAAVAIPVTRIFGRWQSPPPEQHLEFDYDDLPPFSPPPATRHEEQVKLVPLPSRQGDYAFLFSATVIWRSRDGRADEDTVNLGGIAVDAVLKRAVKITERREPDQAPLVQHELGGALAVMETDERGLLEVMAESVELTLSAEDRERLDKLAEVRKNKAVWEHERTYEQSKREYLGEDVLKDTGSAVVWWLARNDDRIEKAADDIGLLARLSSAANNRVPAEEFVTAPSPAPNGASTIDHYAAFIRSLRLESEHQNALLTHQLAMTVGKYRPEVSDEMRRLFNQAPSPPPPSDDDVPLPDPPPEDPHDDPPY